MEYKKKLLFFPQNNTHLQNMLLVTRNLSPEDFESHFLDMNSVYKQNLVFPENVNVITISDIPDLERPFYLYPTLKQLQIVNHLHKSLLQITAVFDAMIIGNDGAIQRLLIHSFKERKAATFLIMDGIITDLSIPLGELIRRSGTLMTDLKKYISHAIRLLLVKTKISNLHYLFPILNAASPVTAIYVIGEHSKDVIRKYNRHSEIQAWGLPRMKYLFQPGNYAKEEKDPEKRDIWFLTSAFLWHNLHKENLQQHQDLKIICETIAASKAAKPVTFYIKLHPREVIESYYNYASYPFVKLVTDTDMISLYDSSALIFSNVSTCILEGAARGKRIYSIMINFEWWKLKRTFLKEKFVEKIFTIQNLADTITKYIIHSNRNGMDKLTGGCDYVISSQSPESDHLIAQHIAKSLSN